MLAGLGTPLNSHLEKIQTTLKNMPGLEEIPQELNQSEPESQMSGVSMICLATSMSGSKTITTIVTMVHQMTEHLGLTIPEVAIGCCVAIAMAALNLCLSL